MKGGGAARRSTGVRRFRALAGESPMPRDLRRWRLLAIPFICALPRLQRDAPAQRRTGFWLDCLRPTPAAIGAQDCAERDLVAVEVQVLRQIERHLLAQPDGILREIGEQ